jgi:hypothetical protein
MKINFYWGMRWLIMPTTRFRKVFPNAAIIRNPASERTPSLPHLPLSNEGVIPSSMRTFEMASANKAGAIGFWSKTTAKLPCRTTATISSS